MQDGARWVGSKNSKPIPILPCACGARLKSRPIPAPLPLWGGENSRGAKWGGAGQTGWGKITIPILNPKTVFCWREREREREREIGGDRFSLQAH